MDSQLSLKELVEKLSDDQRSFLKDLLLDVIRVAARLRSYPEALTQVLRDGEFTRATSDRPIKELTQENAPIKEVNHPITPFTLLVAVQSELNIRVPPLATELYKCHQMALREILVELGLEVGNE
jgi:hypothetical protein